MKLFRVASSGMLMLLSGTLVCASVSDLSRTPSGQVVMASFHQRDSSFQVLADQRCIGEIQISPQDETIIIKGKFSSVEAGELELSLGLVFNQLSQLSQALGVVRVKGEEIFGAEVQGVTPLRVTLRSSKGWPLPEAPSIPVMITKFTDQGRIQLVLKGLGPRGVSPQQQLTALPNFISRFEFKAANQTACEYLPFSFLNGLK